MHPKLSLILSLLLFNISSFAQQGTLKNGDSKTQDLLDIEKTTKVIDLTDRDNRDFPFFNSETGKELDQGQVTHNRPAPAVISSNKVTANPPTSLLGIDSMIPGPNTVPASDTVAINNDGTILHAVNHQIYITNRSNPAPTTSGLVLSTFFLPAQPINRPVGPKALFIQPNATNTSKGFVVAATERRTLGSALYLAFSKVPNPTTAASDWSFHKYTNADLNLDPTDLINSALIGLRDNDGKRELIVVIDVLDSFTFFKGSTVIQMDAEQGLAGNISPAFEAYQTVTNTEVLFPTTAGNGSAFAHTVNGENRYYLFGSKKFGATSGNIALYYLRGDINSTTNPGSIVSVGDLTVTSGTASNYDPAQNPLQNGSLPQLQVEGVGLDIRSAYSQIDDEDGTVHLIFALNTNEGPLSNNSAIYYGDINLDPANYLANSTYKTQVVSGGTTEYYAFPSVVYAGCKTNSEIASFVFYLKSGNTPGAGWPSNEMRVVDSSISTAVPLAVGTERIQYLSTTGTPAIWGFFTGGAPVPGIPGEAIFAGSSGNDPDPSFFWGRSNIEIANYSPCNFIINVDEGTPTESIQSVYPNPSLFGNDVKVQFSSNLQIQKMRVFDMTGKVVAEKGSFEGSEVIISTSNFSQGTYTVNFEMENGNALVEKFIIQ